MHWDNLRHFLAVARSGSLSGAARRLRVNPATVLRHIEQLEQELETRLFLREPSGYVRTSAGERLMARAVALEQEIFACQETVANETAVAGPVVITVTEALATLLLCCGIFPRSEQHTQHYASNCVAPSGRSVAARGGYRAAVGEVVPTRSALATDRAA